MTRRRRRKCRKCGELYEPDPRNTYHQKFCSKPECRMASKNASQNRWRVSPKGRDYFNGAANVLRVQAWRKTHPGYWRKQRKKPVALQDLSWPQTLDIVEDKPGLKPRALQDLIGLQGSLLLGLIANLTGSPLQENIASTTHRLILLGHQIRGLGRQTHEGGQTSAVPGAAAQSAAAVQLDRSPADSG